MKLPETNYLFQVGTVVLRTEKSGCLLDKERNVLAHCVYVDEINRPLVEASMAYCNYSKQGILIPDGRIYYICDDPGITVGARLKLMDQLDREGKFYISYSNYSFENYAKPITVLPLLITESKHIKTEYSPKFWITLIAHLHYMNKVPMNMYFDEGLKCFGIIEYPNASGNCVFSGIEPDGYGPHQ